MTGGALERTRPSHFVGPSLSCRGRQVLSSAAPCPCAATNIHIHILFLFICKYSEIVAVTAGAPVLFNKSSSDDRPGPGICSCKYVEDVKAARSVRVWDRVPMKKQWEGGKSSQAQPPVLAPPSTFLTPIICLIICLIFYYFYSLRKRFIIVTQYG